ncbi:MAG: glycosyltransferase family 4 protein [Phycisphaerales bacterium]|nr:MAG: glycosyltransferase family 4 protein [Phycisphaerales bacterium]
MVMKKRHCYDRQIIAVSFGDPLSHATFSGYSRHLFLAMQEICEVEGGLSSRLLRITDIPSACVDLTPLRRLERPIISPHWLWSPKTIQKLSRRLQKRLSRFDETIPVLQVGTHVYPVNTNRKFYCVTDMTVKQAVDNRCFRVSELKPEESEKAISVQKEMFDSHEKVFVLCEWTRSSVVNDYGCAPEKVIVVGAGANMPPLEPAENKYRSNQILFVGCDWVRKGGPLLLEAFAIVKRSIPDAKLNVVGCNPGAFGPGVNVFGILRKDKDSQMNTLRRLYSEANVFCILPEFDPFPNVLLEAQITSTPVVCLTGGSRADAVQRDVAGKLVEKHCARSVAAAIVEVLSNPELAEQMGSAGKKAALERFVWPKVAERILSHVFVQQ